MSEPIQCKTCDQPVPPEAYPWHATGHQIAGLGEELKRQVQTVTDELTDSVNAAMSTTAAHVAEALKPLQDRIGKLDPTPSPEDVQAHLKEGCTRCKARWDPIFAPKPPPAPAPTAEPPKAEAKPPEAPPAAPAAPQKPKRAAFAPRELSPFKLRAFKVQPIETEGDKVHLRVPDERAAQLAAREGIAPKCQWVKDADGWHYACEEK